MPIPVFFFFNETATTAIYTLSLHDALPIFLTLMRPSLVLFLVLWLKLVKDFLKVRCRLALLQRTDRKSGSAGMPRPISYAVFCLKKKTSDLAYLPSLAGLGLLVFGLVFFGGVPRL